MRKAKKGSKENPITTEELLNLNMRSFIINEATIKDEICNYQYEVTSGIGLGDKHGVTGSGIVDDDMRESFGKFNVHLACMDEVFKHSGINVDNIDLLHTDEFTVLYRVKSFKIKKSKGYESISLKGEKYVSSAGGWMMLSSPEVPLDKLSGYQWWEELKAVSDTAREEVALYKEGKYTPVKLEEPKEDNAQANLFEGAVDTQSDEDLLNAKMD